MIDAPGGLRPRRFLAPTDLATERLGGAFGAAFQPSSAGAMRVWLRGDLGAGKTTFVRGLLRHFGVSGPVRSPSYSLLERYELGALEVLHGDLYRLESPGELLPLGLDEFDRAGALWLVEWPERGGAALPSPDLELAFSVEALAHRIAATAHSPAGVAWLERVAEPAALAE